MGGEAAATVLRRPLSTCVVAVFLFILVWLSLQHGSTLIKYHHNDSTKGERSNLSFSSYLLALGYSEQISAGIHSVMQLSSLALDFRAHLVEPTVVTSHIFGIQGVYPQRYRKNITNEGAVKLFYFFNKFKLNKFLHKFLSTSVNIFSYRNFVREAPSNITIFHFSSPNLVKSGRLFTLLSDEEASLTKYFEENPMKYILNCLNFSGMRYYTNMIESQLNVDGGGKRTKTSFKVSEVFCLNHDHIYRSDQLFQLIPKPRTIIFTNWGGCGLKDCTHRSKDVVREKAAMSKVPLIRHAVLTRTNFVIPIKDESKLHHKRVSNIARRYLKHLGFSPSEFISVHVRMERVIRHTVESKSKADYIKYYKKCFRSITETIDDILYGAKARSAGYQGDYRGSDQVLAMSDRPGLKFGTDTCAGRYCNKKEVMALTNILKKGIEFYSFKPGVLDEVPNAGLVSLVEMHMLSMGKKLILVGFGGFQAVLKNLFLSLDHTEKDVHHICDAH